MEMLGGSDLQESDDVATESNGGLTASLNANQGQETFSKKQEIEKLRTSGSMTQSVSEVARVKNLNNIQMGNALVPVWYFSAYPIEYAHIDTLYICEMCLGYFASAFTLKRHRSKCNTQDPPGNEIYRHEDISFFEIDGRKQRTWCRNLCLLSKLFLDHKTLYYDVDRSFTTAWSTRRYGLPSAWLLLQRERLRRELQRRLHPHTNRNTSAMATASCSSNSPTNSARSRRSSAVREAALPIWVFSATVPTGPRSSSSSCSRLRRTSASRRSPRRPHSPTATSCTFASRTRCSSTSRASTTSFSRMPSSPSTTRLPRRSDAAST